MKKITKDTGGGCSICGQNPAINVSDTYWLCSDCVSEKLEAGEKAIAELKTAKLDSVRLIVQEEMYENSKLQLQKEMAKNFQYEAEKAEPGIMAKQIENLKAEVKRLKEYEFMYKGLVK